MYGNDRCRAIPIQAGIELIEQVHLIAAFGEAALYQCCDRKVDIRFGQCRQSVLVKADRPGVVAHVPSHDPNANLRHWGQGSVLRVGLRREQGAKLLFQIAGEKAGWSPCGEERCDQESDAKIILPYFAMRYMKRRYAQA